MALLRVAQEALANIHRHAHATCARSSSSGAQPTFIDSIRRWHRHACRRALKARGIGLQGMRHRIEMLGGRFRIGNLKRGGTRVSAIVPLDA